MVQKHDWPPKIGSCPLLGVFKQRLDGHLSGMLLGILCWAKGWTKQSLKVPSKCVICMLYILEALVVLHVLQRTYCLLLYLRWCHLPLAWFYLFLGGKWNCKCVKNIALSTTNCTQHIIFETEVFWGREIPKFEERFCLSISSVLPKLSLQFGQYLHEINIKLQ